MIKRFNIQVTDSLYSRKYPFYYKRIVKNYLKWFDMVFSKDKVLRLEIKSEESKLHYLSEKERDALFLNNDAVLITYDEFKTAASSFILALNKHLKKFENVELRLLASTLFNSCFFYKNENLFFSINYEEIAYSTNHTKFSTEDGNYISQRVKANDSLSTYLNAYSEASDKYYKIESIAEYQNKLKWILDDWQIIFDYAFLYPIELSKDYYEVIKKQSYKDYDKKNRKNRNS